MTPRQPHRVTSGGLKQDILGQIQKHVLTNTMKNKETTIHERFQQIVFFGCEKVDNKLPISTEENRQGADARNVKNEYLSYIIVAYRLAPEEDNFCRKPSCIIVSLFFVVLVSAFPYICSILSNSPAVVHSFLQ